MATSDGTSPPVTFSFSDFLEKMKDPAAADLVRSIKGFIHHFEQRASTYRPNHEADSAAVQDFLRRMEFAFRAHQAWKGATPEVLLKNLDLLLSLRLLSRPNLISNKTRIYIYIYLIRISI